MPKETKPIPEWYQRLHSFEPRYPGDGFNHTIHLLHIADIEYIVSCPCGTDTIWTALNPEVPRKGSWVHICPTCESWHSVLLIGAGCQLQNSSELAWMKN